MNTMATANPQVANPTTPPTPLRLDPDILASLTSVRDELHRRANAGQLPGRSSLDEIFVELFGTSQPRSEQLRILFFAAPLVRRLVLDASDANARVGATEITFGEVRSWLWWLDVMDPLCARMIDLRYFAGLGIKEIALLLHLPPAAVLRELRFSRSWLRIRVPQNERPD
jgi:hypothetical protein